MRQTEMMARLASAAARHLAKDGECVPCFIGFTADGEQFVIPTLWTGEKDKVLMLGAIRRLFAEAGVIRYAMISEAWVAEVDPRTQPELINIMPSDREDRQEVVVIALVEKDAEPMVSMWSIERPASGPPSLSPREDFAPDIMEGRMLDLLKDGRP